MSETLLEDFNKDEALCKFEPRSKKSRIIFYSVVGVVFLIMLIIIIVLVSKSGGNNSNNNNNNDSSSSSIPSNLPKTPGGYIYGKYKSKTINESVEIIKGGYLDVSQFLIDGVLYDQKETAHIFEKPGTHDVYIIFQEKLETITNFYNGHERIVSLDMTKLDVSNLRKISLFISTNSILSIDMSNLKFNSLTGIDTLSAYNLETLNLEGVSMPLLKSYYFYDLYRLSNLNLKNFNTQNFETMDLMFRNLNALTSLDLSSFNTQKVTNMKSMFENCYELTSLDLSSFHTPLLKNMEKMFKNCQKLAYINLSNLDTSNMKTSDWSEAFTGLSSTGVIIKSSKMSNLIDSGAIPEGWTVK